MLKCAIWYESKLKIFFKTCRKTFDGSNYNIKRPLPTHAAHSIPGTSPEGPNLQNLQETFRRLSGNQYKNWWFNENFFRSNSPCIKYPVLFYRENKYLKFLNGDVHVTSKGSSCGTSQMPNDGNKHIKLILTGYSKLYSEK